MKNIRVFEFFLNNIDENFKIRYFRIFLSRTYIFNLYDDSIYYRKSDVFRKIYLVGKEKFFLLNKKVNFSKVNFAKYGIKNINNILLEYIYCNKKNKVFGAVDFDIIENNRKRIITSDSIIRKIYKDEVVTMCFDERKRKLSNVIRLNNLKKKDCFRSLNSF